MENRNRQISQSFFEHAQINDQLIIIVKIILKYSLTQQFCVSQNTQCKKGKYKLKINYNKDLFQHHMILSIPMKVLAPAAGMCSPTSMLCQKEYSFPTSAQNIIGIKVGCPRKCVFNFRRNTEFFEKYTEFRGISQNSAVFFAVKFPGIPRNSVGICIRNSAGN